MSINISKACCTQVVEMGCVPICGVLDFNIIAPYTGTYLLQISFLNKIIYKTANFVAGDSIKYNVGQLNPNMYYIIKILDNVSNEIDGICYSFRTVLSFNKN